MLDAYFISWLADFLDAYPKIKEGGVFFFSAGRFEKFFLSDCSDWPSSSISCLVKIVQKPLLNRSTYVSFVKLHNSNNAVLIA